MLLRVTNVDTYYGEIHILQGLSLEVGEGSSACSAETRRESRRR